VRVTIDNNFFDSYETLAISDQTAIDRAFQTRRLTLYVSSALIEELLSIVDSRRDVRLDGRSAWLRRVMTGRYLAPIGDTVRNELKGLSSPFLIAHAGRNLDALLDDTAAGRRPDALHVCANAARERKDKAFAHMRSIQARIRVVF